MNTPMHRFKYTKLTKEQIAAKLVRTAAGPKCVSGFSDVLVGKSLKTVTDDGPVLSYSFKDKNRLTFSENGGTSVEAGYGALTLKQMVFFSHTAPKTLKGYNVFIDLPPFPETSRGSGPYEYPEENQECERRLYGHSDRKVVPDACRKALTEQKAVIADGFRDVADHHKMHLFEYPPIKQISLEYHRRLFVFSSVRLHRVRNR